MILWRWSPGGEFSSKLSPCFFFCSNGFRKFPRNMTFSRQRMRIIYPPVLWAFCSTLHSSWADFLEVLRMHGCMKSVCFSDIKQPHFQWHPDWSRNNLIFPACLRFAGCPLWGRCCFSMDGSHRISLLKFSGVDGWRSEGRGCFAGVPTWQDTAGGFLEFDLLEEFRNRRGRTRSDVMTAGRGSLRWIWQLQTKGSKNLDKNCQSEWYVIDFSWFFLEDR